MTEFAFTELLPLGPDPTSYRRLDIGGVGTVEAAGRTFLTVPPGVLTALAAEAMHDIAHYLRPGHLAQLRRILDDPEASANDRFVAIDLLQNANISAAGVLPMCQDTGTAIVKAKKGQLVLTGGGDEAALARGIFDTYQRDNLRYSQMAPLTMWDEVNTKTNLPAEIKIAAVDGERLQVPVHGQGRRLGQQVASCSRRPRPCSTRSGSCQFLDEKLRLLGTSACPPYHLAVVIGGTSAELAVETAKLASARYLDAIPTEGSEGGHGFRDLEMEQEVLALTQDFGIGAQFGGKYFCHDVRVIRLPRHGASCPVGIAVSCSADRQALAKITADGVFLEDLERNPAQYLPEVTDEHLGGDVVAGRPEPAHGRDPRRAVQVPGEDPALAHRHRRGGPRHRPRQDRRAARRRRRAARSTCGTTPCTTPARPRPRRATPRAASAPPRRGAWTPTSSASRPPAGRW